LRTLMLMPVRDAAQSLPTVLKALERLDPQPDQFVFCENNSTDGSLDILAKFPKPKIILRYWIRDDASFAYGSERVAIARQFLLGAARKTKPDFAIFIDADILWESVGLIDTLIGHDADVLGGLYMRWMPKGQFPAPTLFPAYLPFDPSFASFYPLEKCLAVGAGCLALKQRVISDCRLHFDSPPRRFRGMTMPEDLSYTLRACELGYEVFVAKDVRLTHLKQFGVRRPWD
jgi:glycosyltransferase involved in cell wall biosynthesis